MQSQSSISTSVIGRQANDLPLVSVLMPAYNHERFVEQAVKSVWDQTYKHVELIIIDDGSSDRTLKILQELCTVSPIKMTVHAQQNRGVCRTLNRCFELSNGEWIAFLASDDQYQNNFIDRMVCESKLHPHDSTVLHCDAIGIDERGKEGVRLSKIRKIPPINGDAFYSISYGRGFIVSSTMFLSRKLMEKVGPYDVNLKAEDFDMHLRLARHAKFVFIDEPLFFARKVKGSLGSRRQIWSDDIFVALEKHKNFIGNDYKKIIKKQHKRLAFDCYSDFDFQGAIHHLRHGTNTASGTFKVFTLLEFLIGFIPLTPRGLAIYLLPAPAIRYARTLKHWVISTIKSHT